MRRANVIHSRGTTQLAYVHSYATLQTPTSPEHVTLFFTCAPTDSAASSEVMGSMSVICQAFTIPLTRFEIAVQYRLRHCLCMNSLYRNYF